MSRSLRIQEPGLWHHVMNRGMERRVIFTDDADAGAFFDLVADVGERWQVWCHAACLINTHYHLLLHDQSGALSRAMRHIDGLFTQFFNRRRGRDGPLMSGRYRSRVVQREEYLMEVIRYIHANPIEAGLVNRAAEYAWSSHCWYLEPSAPNWLRREAVFERFGSNSQGREAFDTFVHERVPQPMRAALRSKQWMPIVGSVQFVLEWKERIRNSQSYRNREVPEARRSSAWKVEAVLKTACRVFSCRRRELVR